MKSIKYLFFLLIVIRPAFVLSDQLPSQAELIALQRVELIDKPALMIGMGLTKQLNGDFYIGAFYLDESVQYGGGKEFFQMDVPRRMVFKIASKRPVHASSFVRNLIEGIKINNEAEKLKAEGRKVRQIMRHFHGSFRKGDTISFDYHRNFGVRVRLNGRILGQVKGSNQLYGLLVNMWVGDRPPSSKFKTGIMGGNSSEDAVGLLKSYFQL